MLTHTDGWVCATVRAPLGGHFLSRDEFECCSFHLENADFGNVSVFKVYYLCWYDVLKLWNSVIFIRFDKYGPELLVFHV